MPQSLELPAAVAKAFVRNMRANFAERNELKRDEIAARQLHALNELRRPRDKRLRLADVKAIFLEMRDQQATCAASVHLAVPDGLIQETAKSAICSVNRA